MAHGMISLLGLYQYDNTVLTQMQLPASLNRDNVLDNILMETAELEILWPDPVVLKNMIGIWSRRRVKIWEDLYKTTVLNYNPIWNKDANITESEDEDISRKLDTTETRNLSGTRNETRDLADSLTHSVYGYNSSTAAPQASDSGTNTGTDNISLTDTGTVKNAGTSGETRGTTRTRVEQGNIGVTSTQQLIEEQRAVVDFTVTEKIIQDFKDQFCLLVW